MQAPSGAGRTARTPIDDVIGPGLRLLIVGINPGTRSAELNRHYARAGNRFWPALSASGLVPHPVTAAEQHLLPHHGIGLTNLVSRPSAAAAEVTTDELRRGAEQLQALVDVHRPAVVAVLGVTAYRTAFARPAAVRGPQDDHPGWWVLDNPSGLNAHATVPILAEALGAAGRAAGLPLDPSP